MRNKILFFILLTFCLGLSAQHRMVNTAVTEQTGKKVSKLSFKSFNEDSFEVSMYMVRVMSRQMSGVRIPMMCYRLLI